MSKTFPFHREASAGGRKRLSQTPRPPIKILLIAGTLQDGEVIARNLKTNRKIRCRVAAPRKVTFSQDYHPQIIFLCCDGMLNAATDDLIRKTSLRDIPVIKVYNNRFLTSREKAVLIVNSVESYLRRNDRPVGKRGVWTELNTLIKTVVVSVALLLLFGLLLMEGSQRLPIKSIHPEFDNPVLTVFQEALRKAGQ